MKLHAGLTLIELLVAMALSAIIAIGTFKLFHSSVSARDTLTEQAGKATSISRALRVIENDFIQWSPNRSVRDAFGEYQPAMKLDFEGLFLTRNGWAYSKLMPYKRSNLQRVSYRLAEPGSEFCEYSDDSSFDEQGGCLIRRYTSHLDDDGSLTWNAQHLLRPVKSMEWKFLVFDKETKESSFVDSPPVDDYDGQPSIQILEAVELTLNYGDGGEYKRLIATPSLPDLNPEGEQK